MTQWKPMDTAPKDGTHILLRLPPNNLDLKGGVTEGWWSDDFERWEVLWLDVHGCGCCGGAAPHPDGWMELPA